MLMFRKCSANVEAKHLGCYRGKHGANAHYFALGTARVYEDLLVALYRLKRPDRLLGVRCFFGDLLPDGRKLLGGDDCRGMIATLDHQRSVGSFEPVEGAKDLLIDPSSSKSKVVRIGIALSSE